MSRRLVRQPPAAELQDWQYNYDNPVQHAYQQPYVTKVSKSGAVKPIAKILALLALGVGIALAQHFFYQYLNQKEVETLIIPQTWVIRISLVMAFSFKVALSAAIGFAFAHVFWFLIRKQAMSISGIDSIFGVLGNPFKFFNGDLLFNAKLLTLLAAISWLLPIAPILAPGALTGTSSHSSKI